jgi:hypothetical protein
LPERSGQINELQSFIGVQIERAMTRCDCPMLTSWKGNQHICSIENELITAKSKFFEM